MQIDALAAAGVQIVYQEAASSARARPELEQCLKALRPGDTLTVWRLDRLGRSLAELVSIVTDLEARGIAFHSLTEQINTGSAAGRLMLHVFGAMAEFERNLIRERTRAGLAAARARGRVGGRPRAMSPAAIRQGRALLADPEARVVDVAARMGVSRSTLYKYCS